VHPAALGVELRDPLAERLVVAVAQGFAEVVDLLLDVEAAPVEQVQGLVRLRFGRAPQEPRAFGGDAEPGEDGGVQRDRVRVVGHFGHPLGAVALLVGQAGVGVEPPHGVAVDVADVDALRSEELRELAVVAPVDGEGLTGRLQQAEADGGTVVVGPVPRARGGNPVAAQGGREHRGLAAAFGEVRDRLLVEAADEVAVDRVVVVQARGEDPVLPAGLRLLADELDEVGDEVPLELGLGDAEVGAVGGEGFEAAARGGRHLAVDGDDPQEVAAGLGVQGGERQLLQHELPVREPLLVEHADAVPGGDDVQERRGLGQRPEGGARVGGARERDRPQLAADAGGEQSRQSHGGSLPQGCDGRPHRLGPPAC
jgi:hypothetical protein